MRRSLDSSVFLAFSAVIMAAVPLGCGKSATPGGADPAASGSAAPVASGNLATPAPAADAAAGPKKIKALLKDVQLFNPYSSNRSMPSASEDGSLDTGHSQLRHGLGIVIEATNDTGEILRYATFEGQLKLTGAGGEQVCHFSSDSIGSEYGTRFLSYSIKPPPDPTGVGRDAASKATWFDESGSVVESPWRPAERIRMVSRRSDCRTPVLDDMGVTAIHGHAVVKGWREFSDTAGAMEFDDKSYDLALDGDVARIRDKKSSKLTLVPLKEVIEMVAVPDAPRDGRVVPLTKLRLSRFVYASEPDTVQSEPIEFDLNPAALSVQMVKLPTGDFAHAAGNLVIYLKDGKVAYEDMAKLHLSLHDVERKDVPPEPPEVGFEADELSGKVTDLKIVHFTDDPTLNKGQRRLSATWHLSLKGDDIEGRLKAAVDAATTALDAAERVEVQADIGSDAPAKAKAKADLAKAKADKTAAETRFKTSLSGERGKLTKLLSCGDIKLVTTKGVRGATNGKSASDTCKVLDKVNEVDVTLNYAIDRYELPVAMTYSIGKAPTWNPIASARLLKLDPR
ncbi:MAG: hypothetical protein ABJE95_03750 [Byssovorax sp.]